MFKSRSLGRRHFRPSPDEARAYFKFRPRRSLPRPLGGEGRGEGVDHRAQIRADIERAKREAIIFSGSSVGKSISAASINACLPLNGELCQCGAPATGRMNHNGEPRCCADCAFHPEGCDCWLKHASRSPQS
jgi:hypothetical protein